MRKAFSVTIAIAVAAIIAVRCTTPAQTSPASARPGTGTPWNMPADLASADEATAIEFAWDTFIALNWPAATTTDAERGQPDPSASFGQTDTSGTPLPVAWLGYKHAADPFMTPGLPGDWNDPPALQCTSDNPGRLVLYELMHGPGGGNGAGVIGAIDEAAATTTTNAGPLVDQQNNYVLFQTLMNRTMFEYIVTTQYSNAAIQKAAVAAGKFVSPPKTAEFTNPKPNLWEEQGALLIKAAWRILTKGVDDFSRYYTVPATLNNAHCTDVTVGLVGFHILRLTPKTSPMWFWATFEQVDNVETTAPGVTPSLNPGPGGPTPPPYPNGFNPPPPLPVPTNAQPTIPATGTGPNLISRLTPIRDVVATANERQWAKMTPNNLWKNYQLIDVIYKVPTNTAGCVVTPSSSSIYPSLCTLANTTLEPYFQRNSCLNCHASATPVGGTAPANQIFTFVLQRAGTPPQRTRAGAADRQPDEGTSNPAPAPSPVRLTRDPVAPRSAQPRADEGRPGAHP